MTTEQFSQLLVELHAIKALLARQPAPGNRYLGTTTPATVAAPSTPADIPMPVSPVANAEQVRVHFGKNKDKTLGELSGRSVEWYAQEQAPKLKNDGTPFPPRAEDVALREAARTLVHIRRGTIPNPGPVLSSESVTTTMNDEQIPF